MFDTCGPTQTPDDIDIDAQREKYLHERDKRMRTDGGKQYLELNDDFAEFAEVDPHTPVTPRTPIAEDVEVAILGGGIAGLLVGAYPKKAGIFEHCRNIGKHFGLYGGAMLSGRVAVVGWLAHETCSITGEILVALAGGVATAMVAETPGVYRPSWSIADVGANVTAIRDDTQPLVFPMVPDGHGDHVRYSFGMAAQNA